jgi:hypothetical protein
MVQEADMVTDEEVSPEVMEEFTELMDDLAARQRDPNIPAGTTVGESNIEGMTATWKKQNSMHHLGGQPLPERVPLYHWPDNEISLIPTALIFKRLARVDDGHRTWSRKPFPDATPPEYIIREVPHMPGGAQYKKFIDESAYETFMKNKDPDRWESTLRQQERQERELDRQEQRALTAALIESAGGKVPGATEPASEPVVAKAPSAICDKCGFEAKDQRGLGAHQRGKKDEIHRPTEVPA